MEVNTVATEKSVRVFDNFFDLFNTRHINEHERKLKPDLQAYYHTCDKRLQVWNTVISTLSMILNC